MGNNTKDVRRFSRLYDALLPHDIEYNFRDKKRAISQHIDYMLNRLQAMFKWENLPESMPQKFVELYLQTNGNFCAYKYKGNLYAFTGGLGGPPDPYYRPTIYTISNPALELSNQLEIDKECIVVANDSLYMGLLPLCSRFASAMVETELSLSIATINTRIVSLLSASDDRTKASAEAYLNQIEAGNLGVVAENAFFDGIKSQPYAASGNSNTITNLIELEQYWWASWLNAVGLQANYNMKRESLNSAETALNLDALGPTIDDMLENRRIGAEKINSMYGTNISVDLSSSWKDNAEEITLALASINKDTVQASGPGEDGEDGEDGEGGETNVD